MKLLTLFGLLVLVTMALSGPVDSEDQELEQQETKTVDDTKDTGKFFLFVYVVYTLFEFLS